MMNHTETRQVLDALERSIDNFPANAQHKAAIALCEASLARVVEPVEPGVEQLIAQLHDNQKWTVAEQQQFAVFLKRFPNESSQGIVSLGDAWKHGKACATPQAAAQPSQALELGAENERLRVALRFYANGEHYYLDETEDFDTVSGEPANWLHSGVEDSATSIEDGSVARLTLRGEAITWIDGDEDGTPARIDGEPDPAAINAKGTP